MKGFIDIPIRFFIYDEEAETFAGDTGDFIECNEADFIDANGAIEYERHTVHANGCKQICLTKNPLGKG